MAICLEMQFSYASLTSLLDNYTWYDLFTFCQPFSDIEHHSKDYIVMVTERKVVNYTTKSYAFYVIYTLDWPICNMQLITEYIQITELMVPDFVNLLGIITIAA